MSNKKDLLISGNSPFVNVGMRENFWQIVTDNNL